MTPTVRVEQGNQVEGLFKGFFKLIKPQTKILVNVFLSSIILTILGIIGAFRTQLLIYLGQNMDIPLMLGYYEHVINLPMNFFGTREVGEIISRFNDASKIRDAISGVTLTIMVDSFMIIVLVFNKPLEEVNRSVMEDNAKITSYLIQSLNGVETVKAFNAEGGVNLKTEKRFISLIKSVFKNGWINNLYSSIDGSIKAVFGIVLLWVGTYEILKGNMSIGEFISFNALLAYFLDTIENIINLQSQLQTAVVAGERLGEILDLELEKSFDEEKKIKPKTLLGNIEIKNLYFR